MNVFALWKMPGVEQKQEVAVRGFVCICVYVHVSTICEIESVAKLIRKSCNTYNIVCSYKNSQASPQYILMSGN